MVCAKPAAAVKATSTWHGMYRIEAPKWMSLHAQYIHMCMYILYIYIHIYIYCIYIYIHVIYIYTYMHSKILQNMYFEICLSNQPNVLWQNNMIFMIYLFMSNRMPPKSLLAFSCATMFGQIADFTISWSTATLAALTRDRRHGWCVASSIFSYWRS